MLVAIADSLERHRAEEVARLDSAERAIRLLMLDQPSLGGFRRFRAHRSRRMPIIESQQAVDLIEHVAHRQGRLTARLLEVRAMRRPS